MRRRIYDIINQTDENDKVSQVYSILMIILIAISLIPLLFKNEHFILQSIDRVCVTVFIIDYILRLITADFKYGKHSILSFMRYPVSGWAIIDLLSILPSLTLLNNGFKVLRVLRMGRAFRVFRVFKTFRYSRNFEVMMNVLRYSRTSLIAVCSLAAAYIFLSAVIIFNVEPDTFDNFFDAIYWATVSLTAVGYGDIYPVTIAGKIVAMASSVVGIAIVALPAGIITAGYMKEIGAE